MMDARFHSMNCTRMWKVHIPRQGPALLLVVGLAAALVSTAPADNDDRIGEVRATQTARFQAMLIADVAALTDVLADDLVYAHTTGTIDSKSSMIENIGSGAVDYEQIEATDSRIRLFSDVAVVTGSANLRVSVGDQVHQVFIRFIEVYAFRDDQWQLVSWQSTRVP